VYGVKRPHKIHRERHGVSVDKFKREVWLRFNIHPNNFKPGAGVSNGNAASAAKQVKELRFHSFSHI